MTTLDACIRSERAREIETEAIKQFRVGFDLLVLGTTPVFPFIFASKLQEKSEIFLLLCLSSLLSFFYLLLPLLPEKSFSMAFASTHGPHSLTMAGPSHTSALEI